MLGKLFLAFTVVTLIELGLLIELGGIMGAWPTIALVLATGFFGAWLAREQGTRTLQKAQADLNRGAIPADALMDGVLILISGAFLLTPGVITDGLGFLLLIPPFRVPVKAWARAKFQRWIETGAVHIQSGGLGGFGGFAGPGGAQGFGGGPRVVPRNRRAEAVDITPTDTADGDA